MEDFKNCLIFEVYKGSKLTKLNESQENVPEGMMRVTGVAAVIGVQNRNGRIYNKENYLKHIELLQPDIADGLYGELEHPEGFTINNNNISHKIEAVWFDPATNEVKITLLLLDTEKGRIAQSIIRSGGSLRVSSRAMGSVNKNHEAMIEKLVTYDIVGTPGFKETSLHLSENMQMIGKDSLCESYVFFPESSQLNENMFNKNNKETMANQKNKTLLEQELERRKAARLNEQQFVTKEMLNGPFAMGLQKWMNEDFSSVIQNWVVNTCFPLFESYMKRKAINESKGISACSFGQYFALSIKEANRLNESKQEPQNGDIVLSQEEKDAVQKCIEGQKLTQEEQKLFQQAQEKLQQQQQKLQENQQEPQNGELVLSEQEQQAVKKLQEGQEQLDAEELKQAQQGLQKMQQQQQQQQQQQKSQEDQEKEQQQLRESLNEKLNESNTKLSEAYRRLLESDDPQQQDKINQEIDQLKQEVTDVQAQIDGISENQQQKPAQKQNEGQQSEPYQKCVQKLQQDEELTQDDLKDLTEDELQDILDQQEKQQKQQKKQNEGADNYDDPNDAKVFENGDEKPLPSKDDVNESLVGKEAANLLKNSGSLLESLSKRMEAALGKN